MEAKESERLRVALSTSPPRLSLDGEDQSKNNGNLAIDQASKDKKKKDRNVANGASPVAPVADGMPALWIRAVDGNIKHIADPAAAAAPSAVDPGVHLKNAKKLKGIKNDADLWAAFERQQQEEAAAQLWKKPPLAGKGKMDRMKSFRKGGASQAGITVEDVLANIPLSGVKISLEQTVESKTMKEEDIAKTLASQAEKERKDQTSKKEKEKEKHIVEKKPQTIPFKPKRKKQEHHLWYINHDTYMFHLHQPGLTGPLFKLASDRQILFGAYDSKLDAAEAKVAQQRTFRVMESLVLPDERNSVDLSLPRLVDI